MYQSLVLLILDGWGIGPAWGGNAISQAQTPLMDRLWRMPTAVLDASGAAVGLSGHERGNSEVGHLNLGAGRVVIQDSTRINEVIATGALNQNATLLNVLRDLQASNKRLHLIGLLSHAAIHADTNHALALVKLAHDQGVKDIRLHVFTDGRDSGPRDGLGQMINFEQTAARLGGTVQTVIGRYLAMDRDQHWDRTFQARDLIAFGEGRRVPTAKSAISQNYANGITDEFIGPTIVTEHHPDYSGLVDGDAVVFWNFRADRARQLTRALTNNGPAKTRMVPHVTFLSMTPYAAEHDIPGVTVVFRPEKLEKVLAAEIANAAGRQFHIAETEKYAHVTYFFNGGREEPFTGEDRLLIPSKKVDTFDQAPEMAAREITHQLIKAIRSKRYMFLVANFANADMVGHTGNFQATVSAVECIDAQVRMIVETCQRMNIPLVVTADHGNAEQMVDPKSGEPATDHTTNPVPCHFVNSQEVLLTRGHGRLADVAPSILWLLGKDVPSDMTGQRLIDAPGGQ